MCMPSRQLATSIKAPQEAVQGTIGKSKAYRCLVKQKRELLRCLCTPLVDLQGFALQRSHSIENIWVNFVECRALAQALRRPVALPVCLTKV